MRAGCDVWRKKEFGNHVGRVLKSAYFIISITRTRDVIIEPFLLLAIFRERYWLDATEKRKKTQKSIQKLRENFQNQYNI